MFGASDKKKVVKRDGKRALTQKTDEQRDTTETACYCSLTPGENKAEGTGFCSDKGAEAR